MKKLMILLMALCLVSPAVEAQNSKALKKAQKKEYKMKMKELKKLLNNKKEKKKKMMKN